MERDNEENFKQKILDLQFENTNIRFDAMDKALKLKNVEMERRLDALNELRAEVLKDRSLFVQKIVYEDKIIGYDKWSRIVDDRLMKMETQYASRITLATAIALFSVIVAIVGVITPWMLR